MTQTFRLPEGGLIDRIHATYWFWRARKELKAGRPDKAGLFAEMIEENR